MGDYDIGTPVIVYIIQMVILIILLTSSGLMMQSYIGTSITSVCNLSCMFICAFIIYAIYNTNPTVAWVLVIIITLQNLSSLACMSLPAYAVVSNKDKLQNLELKRID